MNTHIKALFFDIDGTLVSFQTHKISKTTIDTLYKLKQAGYLLIITTGRGKDGLACLEQFPFDGYITLNGQYCFTNNHIVYENTIDKEELLTLKHILESHPFPCGFVTEHGKVFNYRDERVDEIHRITQNDAHPAGDISHIEDSKVYQVMAFMSEEEEIEILRQMPGCISARWHPLFADISPRNGTKVIGMEKFGEYYGFSMDETMAFGDGGNDIAMLKHAGISIAMGNGTDALKQTADYITSSVDEDGITNAITHFQLLK